MAAGVLGVRYRYRQPTAGAQKPRATSQQSTGRIAEWLSWSANSVLSRAYTLTTSKRIGLAPTDGADGFAKPVPAGLRGSTRQKDACRSS